MLGGRDPAEGDEAEESEIVDINHQDDASPVEKPPAGAADEGERPPTGGKSKRNKLKKKVIKNEIFTVIETKKILQEFEEYLRKTKVFSFFFVVMTPDKKLIQKLSEVLEDAFVSFVSSYDETFLYYFIGGDLKNDLKKTLRDRKLTLEGYDSQIALISISFYEDYLSLLIDRTEKILDGLERNKGFNQHKFKKLSFSQTLKKIKSFLKKELLN